MSIQSISPKYHWTFKEISDSVTKDTISAATATLSNVTLSGQGRIGNAVVLNGSDNSYISLGNSIGQFGRADFTVAFGIKIAKNSKGVELLGNRTSDAHGNFFTIRFSHEQCILVEIDEDNNATNYISLNSTPGFNDETWHHIAFVRQQNDLKLYIDGNLSAGKTSSGIANIANGNELRTGKANPSFLASPKAEFEDIRIYDCALSDQQISALVPPLKEGEIELITAGGTEDVARIWRSDVADLSYVRSTFEKLRLGTNTGATLYKDANFSGTFQEVEADVPQLSQTKLAASPKSMRIWSTVGKPFTGKWAILAPNGQYLSLAYPTLATSPSITAFELFDFHINIEQQRTQLLPGLSFSPSHSAFAILTNEGLRQTLFSVEEETGSHHFSLVNSQKNLWLTFQPLGNLIFLKSYNGQYLRAKNEGRGAIFADYSYPRADSVFELIKLQKDKVALKSFQRGLYLGYLGANIDPVNPVVADWGGEVPDDWHSYELRELGNNRFGFKTNSGTYFCAEDGGGREVVANRSVLKGWETFELIPTSVGQFNWTNQHEERAIFTRAIKIAENESQVGELLQGEAAFSEQPAYWGKTWVFYSSCSDFRAVEGLNDAVSSIRLGSETGVTLYSDPDHGATSQDREKDIEDIVEHVPNLSESQVGNDKLSSVKIWSKISPTKANVSFSVSMSQDYKLVGEELQDFSSYRTIVKFLPEVTEVEVWATDLTKFEVDEKDYEVDEDRSIKLPPNDMNRLMITSEAEGINTPGLKIRTNTMQSHERIVIFPDREVHRQLANLEDGALWEATDAQGHSLINHDSYDVEQVSAVQNTITKTMKTVSYVAVKDQEGNKLLNREISGDTVDKPWELKFSTSSNSSAGVRTFGTLSTESQPSSSASILQETELSQNEFEQLLTRSSAPLAQGIKEWGQRIKNAIKTAASFVVGVAEKVVQFIVITVEQVRDAIKGTVEKVEAWILDTAEKVGAFVEGVVEKIGVAAKQFVEYLRSLFDWGDILDTQRYLADAIDSGLGYAVKLADAAKEPVSNFMSELRETVRDSLNETIDKLEGDKSELDKSGPDLPEQLEWLLSKLTSNSKDSDEDSTPAPANPSDASSDSSDPLDSFISNLLGKFETIGAMMLRSLEGLGETITTLILNPYRPQLALVAILKMVRDVMDDFLQLIEEIAINFLNIIGLVVEKFRQLITSEINFPFITALFKKIGAGTLSALNLTALMVAIPVTISSKLIYGRKPFEGSPQLALSLNESMGFGFKISGLATRGLKTVVDAWEPIQKRSESLEAVAGKGTAYGKWNKLTSSIKILLTTVTWLGSFPKSPNHGGGFPYNIADSSHSVSKSNQEEMYWQRVLWGWRTSAWGISSTLDILKVTANVSSKPGLSKTLNGGLKDYDTLIRIFRCLISCVDIALTSLYIHHVSDDRKKSSQIIRTFPGITEVFKIDPFKPYSPTLPIGLYIIALCCNGTVIGLESDLLRNP
ncbi:LamG-like jellyroll fold domain-containing protein [Microcoleus sp. w1-18aA5]|uniref:LamG-like jellyroll fold domain-containing protein n=1 Tax=Microcoleus sp. w1-18aA5 TaxID=2818982 RepID=UPI002FD104E7